MFLTIAIPTYNRAPILDEALWAICPQAEQRLDQVRVLVVDNASSDHTPDVVAGHVARWNCLRSHRNTENLGLMGNFGRAILESDSEWVWWLGDDDIVFPHSAGVVLAKLRALAEKETAERPISLAVLDWFALNEDYTKLRYPSLTDEQCIDRVFDPGIRVLESHNYHSLAPLSRLIVRRKTWDADLFKRLHQPHHLYTHIRCCMKTAESHPVATFAAPVVGGGEKGNRAYYHAILPVSQLEEFAELDRGYLAIMAHPNWGFRRRQLKRAIYLNLFAVKIGVFHEAYHRHFHVVEDRRLNVFLGGWGAWIACRLARASGVRKVLQRAYLSLRPNMTVPRDIA